MKRIVILTPNYPPESGAAALRIGAIAKGLHEAGWRVRVVTAMPHHPMGVIPPSFDAPKRYVRIEEGVEVVRLRPWIVPKDGLVKRLVSEAWFTVRTLRAVSSFEPDVVLASSPYMFLGPWGRMVSRWVGASFVWDVRDLTWLYPRSAGKRTWGADRVLAAWMRATARRADGLMTTANGQMTYFEKRPALTLVAPNGVSRDRREALEQLAPPRFDSRVVLYAGLLGFNHGIDTLVEVARRLPSVTFRIAGDGPERGMVERAVREEGLSNVELLGHLTGRDLLNAYEDASVLISVVRASPVNRWTQPSKLWEYMASGRPVVHAGEGEVPDLLAGTNTVTLAPAGDVTAIAEGIESILTHPGVALDRAARARAYVRMHRDRHAIVDDIVTFLETASNRKQP